MNYVDWAEQVWQAVGRWWTAAGERDKTQGFVSQELAPLLLLNANFSGTPEEQDEAQAIWDVLHELAELGLLQERGKNIYAYYKPAPRVEADLDAPLSDIWSEIFRVGLTEEKYAFLSALAQIGQQAHPNYAETLIVADTDIYEALGWPWDKDQAHNLYTTLKALHPPMFRMSVYTYGGFQMAPSYSGIVRVTRQQASEWAKRIAEWLVDDETIQTDLKQELLLNSDRQKGEFVKDVLALANTKVRGDRVILIGFVDKTHELLEWKDQSITQETLERILGEYTYPTPRIRYQVVPYAGGQVGILEIYRDPENVPYRPKRSIWKITKSRIYVRHGSHSVPIEKEDEDEEARDLIAEGERARNARDAAS